MGFKAHLEIIPLHKALVRRKLQKKWLMFRTHILQAQSTLSQQAGRQAKYLWACMWEQVVPAKLRHKKGIYEGWKQGQVTW